MQTLKKQLIELSNSSPAVRRAFFKDHFFAWWIYYFSENFVCPLAPFHFDWMETLEKTDKNILIKWFRWSIKTTLTIAYITHSIAYNKYKFIVWQSFESWSSKRATMQIALSLMNEKLENDYWIFFSPTGSREDFEKKAIGDFDTRNGIKILSTSLGEKLRGAISRNARPDLLILDDIDVTDSVRNSKIIDKNEQKIKGETIGAMSKDKSRILFLWNVINTDGVVPRFENEKKNDPNWKIFVQSLYNEDGSIAWEFFTHEMIEKIKSNEWPQAFAQNYLLEPIVSGNKFFTDTSKLIVPEYTKDTKYPEVYIYAPPWWMMFYGVDTAKWWIDGDYSAISVRNSQGKLLAFYMDKIPPDELHDSIINRLFELWYKWRLGIETNNTGIATIDKAKNGKWKNYLYSEKVIDERTNRQTKKLWWTTSSKTRPLMLSTLEEDYRKWNITEIDPRLKEQIPTFIYDDNFKPQAINPYHDDAIIADAICNQMRNFPYLTF